METAQPVQAAVWMYITGISLTINDNSFHQR
jgi:hypothetical protein